MKKPERPYKNYAEFRRKNMDCFHCHGSGKIVKPGEYLDPVEGYKMADRIICPKCQGSTLATDKEAHVVYTSMIYDWKERENLKKAISKNFGKNALTILGVS